MPNIWANFVKSQKGKGKTTRELSHEWKNMQANLVTLNVYYVQSLLHQIDDLRSQLNGLTIELQQARSNCDLRPDEMKIERTNSAETVINNNDES